MSQAFKMNTKSRLLAVSSAWLLSYLLFFGAVLNPFNLAVSGFLRQGLIGLSAVSGLSSLVLSLVLGLNELQASAREANSLCIWTENLADDAEFADEVQG